MNGKTLTGFERNSNDWLFSSWTHQCD